MDAEGRAMQEQLPSEGLLGASLRLALRAGLRPFQIAPGNLAEPAILMSGGSLTNVP